MNVEFESVVKSTEDSMFQVRNYTSAYGSFKIIRIGHIRIIPNTNGQSGTPLKVFTDVQLDDEDVRIGANYQYIEIPAVLCSSTGAYFRSGYLTLVHSSFNGNNWIGSYTAYSKYNTYGSEQDGSVGDDNINFVGALIYDIL